MTVLLNSIEKVKEFVSTVSMLPCDVDLVSGRYTVDAKSIMGIFSLDLSKPISVVVPDGKIPDDFAQKLKEFEYVGE